MSQYLFYANIYINEKCYLNNHKYYIFLTLNQGKLKKIVNKQK